MYKLYLIKLITNKILIIFNKFNINYRIITLTINNDSNIITYGNNLVIELKKEFSNFLFLYYRYTIYIINLTVKIEIVFIKNKIKKLC